MMELIVPRNELHLKFDPVAGQHWFLELEPADFFEAGGDFPPAMEFIQEKEGALNHAFQGHYAGHDGLPGEMARKKELIGGDSFYGPDSLARFRFQNPVDQERRVRMGKTMKGFFQLFPIQGGIFRLGMNGKPPGGYSLGVLSGVEGEGGVSSSPEAEVLMSSIPK